MSPEDQKLIQDSQRYVKNFFATKMNEAFVFHNYQHSQEVVRACEIISGNYKLEDKERLVLLLAAWFHDTGYSNGAAAGHEEYSIKVASSYLTDLHVQPEVIESVSACIMATKMPQSPTNLIEQIICDADLFHLGNESFEEKAKLLRQEINNLQDEPVSKKEWRQRNIEFLQRHRYFTDFCREKLEPIKQTHLEDLLGQLGKKEKKIAEEKMPEPNKVINPMEPADTDNLKKEEKSKKEKDKDPRPERGIVAMFRIMSENHVNLSQMADSKANIMISVNTIVISIMVSLLLGKLQFYPEFIIPTIILVTVCLGAVVFAILATRPNISGGTFTREDIENKKVNLLFFGNFFKMNLPDYEWAMTEMMKDRDYLYGSMIKDIYFLGIVLARKYKFLRISYNIFMFGLIAAILSFCLAFVFSENVA